MQRQLWCIMPSVSSQFKTKRNPHTTATLCVHRRASFRQFRHQKQNTIKHQARLHTVSRYAPFISTNLQTWIIIFGRENKAVGTKYSSWKKYITGCNRLAALNVFWNEIEFGLSKMWLDITASNLVKTDQSSCTQ